MMGAVIPLVPGTPTNLSATPGNAQVILGWTAPADDGGSAIVNYKLYRSTTSGGTYSLVASPSGLTYTDTGLNNGQTYLYKVSAVNAVGEGALSPAVSVLVPQPVSPASDTAMLILVAVIAIAVMLVAALFVLRMRKGKK
jgi:fibronectin type 3 domain-containing protein